MQSDFENPDLDEPLQRGRSGEDEDEQDQDPELELIRAAQFEFRESVTLPGETLQ
ncbi:MAG: hypothetical protein ACJ75G_05830 [Gaiellaceae bacterium]